MVTGVNKINSTSCGDLTCGTGAYRVMTRSVSNALPLLKVRFAQQVPVVPRGL